MREVETGEVGKAAGVKHAGGEIIVLIDSDNACEDGGAFCSQSLHEDEPKAS